MRRCSLDHVIHIMTFGLRVAIYMAINIVWPVYHRPPPLARRDLDTCPRERFEDPPLKFLYGLFLVK